ncbi:hypothetical protein FI667_g10949, partial [Globisporangium splendens]
MRITEVRAFRERPSIQQLVQHGIPYHRDERTATKLAVPTEVDPLNNRERCLQQEKPFIHKFAHSAICRQPPTTSQAKMNKLFFLAAAFFVAIGVTYAADVAGANPALRSLAQVEAALSETNEIPAEKCCL